MFLSLFANRKEPILRPPGCKNWTTVSKHWPLPDGTILCAIDGRESSIWGARWGEHTRFAVLDIDAESKYHDALQLEKLTEVLRSASLSGTLYQSSDSGGWHLYLFLDDWEESNDVEQVLRAWLTVNDFQIRGGTLEVFPSRNGLRLPLQRGFAWLDMRGHTGCARESLTSEAAISKFLDDLQQNANNWETSRKLIASRLVEIEQRKNTDALAHANTVSGDGFDHIFGHRLIKEKYENGRKYWHEGLTQKNQRHEAILCVEHYLWHGDDSAGVPSLAGEPHDEERCRLIRAWLEKKHNGYCNHINRGKWQKVEAQIERACRWRRPTGTLRVRTPYALTERPLERHIALYKQTGRVWSMEDFEKANIKRSDEAREKIRAAVHLLIDEGRQITRNELARVSGCSPRTVSKHRDLWFLLATGSRDLNPVYVLPSASCESVLGSEGSEKKENEIFDSSASADSVDVRAIEKSCSEERASILVAPPFLLPGEKPSNEPPASRPSPGGSCGSLDAGSPVRCYSGRTAEGAGGLKPRCKKTGTANILLCCIRANCSRIKPFRNCVYSDVRGPPKSK